MFNDPLEPGLKHLWWPYSGCLSQHCPFREYQWQSGYLDRPTNFKADLDALRCAFPIATRAVVAGRRKTVLVARELVHYKVDMAALSETRFSEQGQLEEVDAGCTFFWSGRPKAEGRDAGVTFSIQNDIVGRLLCLPQGTNDCVKVTWMHPQSRHWHVLDYVLVRRRDQQDMLVTKAITGADGWMDGSSPPPLKDEASSATTQVTSR
ncbi:unnamed protein product [Schistocephalus solidus]|uniref:Uncharacterized protein n=1 Tax=Schistocephalus solidus TaxID=70667 RepID=A0A183T7W7_SCHSO|nr:unnamed protein product [Schistocephalus solidus]